MRSIGNSIGELFGFQEVLEDIEKGYDEFGANPIDVQKTTDKDNKKKDWKTTFILHQCLDTTIFYKISETKSAKEAWDILKGVIQVVQKPRK